MVRIITLMLTATVWCAASAWGMAHAASALPGHFQTVLLGPREPDFLPIIGNPRGLSVYWHDQRWMEGDFYACALYAQASVMEAMGYDFDEELQKARELGLRDNWYSPETGVIGLGQPFRANNIPFERHGSPIEPNLEHSRALYKLMRELSAGRYAIVNVNAGKLSHYHGTNIRWHTLWVTGIRLDETGTVLTIIVNDSYRGAAVEYPVDEFLDAWASEFNYYAIFIRSPDVR